MPFGTESPADSMEALRAAVAAVRGRSDLVPSVGIVLGTGLGALADDLQVETAVPYEEIPGFPLSTVESHRGRLLLGLLEGAPVVAMQGRFHSYEGYDLRQVTLPIRVMRLLGADTLVVSAATGGMNPDWEPGDLVLLSDHINLLGDNPLVGPNLDELGPRFPDMSEPYDSGLRDMARDVAREAGIVLREGVYVSVQGPCLETRAEYRMLRRIGADVVGMSTVPEVIVARHMDMKVLGITIITDACIPETLQPVELASIIATAARAEPDLTALIRGVVSRLSNL